MAIHINNLTIKEYKQYLNKQRYSLITNLRHAPRVKEHVNLDVSKDYNLNNNYPTLKMEINNIIKGSTLLNNSNLFILSLNFR
jgi:hypothetical protein